MEAWRVPSDCFFYYVPTLTWLFIHAKHVPILILILDILILPTPAIFGMLLIWNLCVKHEGLQQGF